MLPGILLPTFKILHEELTDFTQIIPYSLFEIFFYQTAYRFSFILKERLGSHQHYLSLCYINIFKKTNIGCVYHYFWIENT